MMQTRILLCFACLLLFSALLCSAAPLATFDCREITGHDWARTLVTYPVQFKQGQVKPGNVRLVDAAGTEQPCQFSRVERYKDGSLKTGRLSFYAELPKGNSYHYELQPGKPGKLTASPTASVKNTVLTLDNSVMAVRIPAGRKIYKTPLSFCADHAKAAANAGNLEKAGIAFGPIAGIRLADSKWVGGSYFSYQPIDAERLRQKSITTLPVNAWARADKAAPKVTGYETTVTEQGPLFADAKIRFTFSNGGYYQLVVRILAGDPALRVDETMDLKTTSEPDDPLYVNLLLDDSRAGGWRPDCLYGYNPRGGGQFAAFNDVVKTQKLSATVPNLYPFSMPIAGDQDGKVLTDVTPAYPWQSLAHYFGVVQLDQVTQKKTAPFLAIVPQHAGTWRGAAFVFPPKSPQLFHSVLAYANGDVVMRWTIRNQPHVQNVLHTGEYDPDFGLTAMRRLWNLVGGPFQYHDTLYPMRAVEGFVSLDNYKDWTLAWDADTKAGVALPAPLDRYPGGAIGYLQQGFLGGDGGGTTWFSHYRQAENMAWAVEVRKTLADPAVSAEKKGQLRAQVAAFCYMMAEPDFNTRACATHQGNPSMPVNRFFALPFAAVLIPDHPMAKVWMDTTREYIKYKLGMNVAPGGGYSELMTYFGAGAPTYVHGALVLKDMKRADDATRKIALGPVDFTLSALPPPDPRFGFRMIPGFGHEGMLRIDEWRPAAALVKDIDPDRAAVYAWAWKEQGQPGESQHCNGFSLLNAKESILADAVKPEAIRKAMASAWIPGFGAVLHSHPGDPQETYFGYRQGYLTSHSDANQGDFVIYAKGAPLTTTSLFGYAISSYPDYIKINKEYGWHSNVRLGSQQNWGGWPGGGPVTGVHRSFFSDSVDYLRGMGDYSTVVGENSDIGRDLTAPDAQRWTRQILFLKGKTPASPNYFVFRDSFANLRGDATQLTQKWWYQRTLGTKEQVQPNPAGFAYTSTYGPRMDVHFLQPATVALESRTAQATGPVGGGGLGVPTKNPYDGGLEKMTVTAVGPISAGQDILVAIYPQGKDEAAPQYQALADGAAKITTVESTDYLFLRPTGMTFAQGDVAFQGIAGAARIYPDAVHLIVSEGAGTVTYKGYTLKAGKPVTKVVPLAEIAKGGTVEVKADPVSITFALDPQAGPITEVQPGVKKQVLATGAAYLFDSAVPLHFAQDSVVFDGTRGGIRIDHKAGTTQLVMLAGTKIGAGSALAEVADGPYQLTFFNDRVVGIAEGPARFLHVSKPAGLNTMPGVTIDGISYAPGGYTGSDAPLCTHINPYSAIIALKDGQTTFTLGNLPQPPVFRSWELW
ncbi:MAG: hypothetical protein ACYDBB_07880 [Armatimonadota bacterium]